MSSGYAGILLCALLISIGLSPKPATTIPAATFPADWVGRWSGELAVLRGADTAMRSPMSLAIARVPGASGDYTWAITYGAAGDTTADVRPYLLRAADSTGTRWDIDERNGITLGAELHGGVLYSRFEVMGNLLLARDELRGDTLHHEIIAGPIGGPGITGDTVLATGDTVPPVARYRVATRQVARLTRRRP